MYENHNVYLRWQDNYEALRTAVNCFVLKKQSVLSELSDEQLLILETQQEHIKLLSEKLWHDLSEVLNG